MPDPAPEACSKAGRRRDRRPVSINLYPCSFTQHLFITGIYDWTCMVICVCAVLDSRDYCQVRFNALRNGVGTLPPSLGRNSSRGVNGACSVVLFPILDFAYLHHPSTLFPCHRYALRQPRLRSSRLAYYHSPEDKVHFPKHSLSELLATRSEHHMFRNSIIDHILCEISFAFKPAFADLLELEWPHGILEDSLSAGYHYDNTTLRSSH